MNTRGLMNIPKFTAEHCLPSVQVAAQSVTPALAAASPRLGLRPGCIIVCYRGSGWEDCYECCLAGGRWHCTATVFRL